MVSNGQSKNLVMEISQKCIYEIPWTECDYPRNFVLFKSIYPSLVAFLLCKVHVYVRFQAVIFVTLPLFDNAVIDEEVLTPKQTQSNVHLDLSIFYISLTLIKPPKAISILVHKVQLLYNNYGKFNCS